MRKNINNGLIKLWDHEFKEVKSGLDEEQVGSFVNELINERDILVKHQEHLPSFALLAERSVVEADSNSASIRIKPLNSFEELVVEVCPMIRASSKA